MFLYLVCIVPLLWALEVDEINRLRMECGSDRDDPPPPMPTTTVSPSLFTAHESDFEDAATA